MAATGALPHELRYSFSSGRVSAHELITQLLSAKTPTDTELRKRGLIGGGSAHEKKARCILDFLLSTFAVIDATGETGVRTHLNYQIGSFTDSSMSSLCGRAERWRDEEEDEEAAAVREEEEEAAAEEDEPIGEFEKAFDEVPGMPWTVWACISMPIDLSSERPTVSFNEAGIDGWWYIPAEDAIAAINQAKLDACHQLQQVYEAIRGVSAAPLSAKRPQAGAAAEGENACGSSGGGVASGGKRARGGAAEATEGRPARRAAVGGKAGGGGGEPGRGGGSASFAAIDIDTDVCGEEVDEGGGEDGAMPAEWAATEDDEGMDEGDDEWTEEVPVENVTGHDEDDGDDDDDDDGDGDGGGDEWDPVSDCSYRYQFGNVRTHVAQTRDLRRHITHHYHQQYQHYHQP